MANDKGFSRIISVVVVIIILILIGIVISISSRDEVDSELVDIIENKQAEPVEEAPDIYEFVGLDVSVGGYKVVSQQYGQEELKTVQEEVGGQYNLLTNLLNQDTVLLVKDFWQDKEKGGRELLQMDMQNGEVSEVMELPSDKVGDFSRFISSAAYSPDNNYIAYATNVYDLEVVDGVGKEGPEYIEIWEYDVIKDIHTLITQVDGGLYVGVDIIGYDAGQKNLIAYQYIGDGSGKSFGQTYFISLEDQSIDKETIQLAFERLMSADEGEADLPKIGRPYLSVNGEYIAYLLPVGVYFGGGGDVPTPVIMYDTKLHEFEDLYQFDKYMLGEGTQDWEEVYNIRWNHEKLYIATSHQVLEYNMITSKLRPLYKWSADGRSIYVVLATNNDGLIISSGSDSQAFYVDYLKATETVMANWQNFEYINIYQVE